MAQENAPKNERYEQDQEVSEETERALGEAAVRDEETQETIDDIDELLDDIGDALEENAQEFIDAYKQKGGQ